MSMKRYDLGQSLMEVMFAVGVLALVLSGVVVLLVTSVSTRTKGFDRNKATRLGELVTEELISNKNNTPTTFWQLQGVTSATRPETEFAGYTYSVGYTMSLPASYTNCNLRVGITDCAEAVINVSWGGTLMGGTTPNLYFQRFFSRN